MVGNSLHSWLVLRGVLGIGLVVIMGLSTEDKDAIMKLWDTAEPKLNKKERKAKLDKLVDERNNLDDKAKYKNSKFEALDDTCGIAICAFLDPSRRHDNPMFDVPPLTTYGFADQLGYEHQVNSVWKM